MALKQDRQAAINEARKNSRIAFDLTQAGLNDLLSQRAEINKQITEHQQDLFRLAPICGIEAKNPLVLMGLTDALRFLIADSETLGMTNDEIRDALLDAKFRLPESNPQAAIQTALKRLVDGGEIEDGWAAEEDRPPNWIWVSPDKPPALPIPEWMTKSPEQIKEERIAALQKAKEEREREEAEKKATISIITDDDIPF